MKEQPGHISPCLIIRPSMRMAGLYLYLLLALSLISLINISSNAQHPYSFHKLRVSDGLNDGVIHAIGQDRYGYIWIGSVGGLNRYNGREVKWFTHLPGDSSGPLASLPESMALDSAGRFWIGFETGLMEYDYTSGRFIPVVSAGNVRINGMHAMNEEEIFLATDKGLAILSASGRSVTFLSHGLTDSIQLRALGRRIYDLSLRGHHLYLAGSTGLWRYDLKSKKAEAIPLNEADPGSLRTVYADDQNQVWAGTYGRQGLLRIDAKGKVHSYQRFLSASQATTSNNVNDIIADRQGGIWVITTADGLLEYLPGSDSFRKHLHHESLPQSPSENLHRAVLLDRDGNIWTGGNHGVNYFHPERQLFQTTLPFSKDLDLRNRSISRAIAEDRNGNIWMATLDGVSRLDPDSHSYKEWNNQPGRAPVIWYNSVRGILCDASNNIWIATGAGVNRYNSATGRMEFIPKEQLPAYFYFGVNKDHEGRIWFACRDGDGFYWFDPSDQSYHGISEHAELKRFARLGGRVMLHDSRGRYWFGFNGAGLGLYDPFSQNTRIFSTADSSQPIAGNIVIDIREDHRGVIWISTHSGISGIDTDRNRVYSFNSRQGMLSNSTSALAVDSLNRLWIATARGINLLDSSRRSFTAFGLSDGLPSDAFSEHPGYIATNGDIIFPSVKGFVRFNPLRYRPQLHHIPFYLSAVSVFSKPYAVAGDISDLKELTFQPSENYFTLHFTSLNYENPGQSWYAYKLEGFDPDWIITRQPEAHYTNVPGGNYQFRFKAGSDPIHWEMPEKQLSIHIAVPLYRQGWFLAVCALLLAGVWFWLYRRRVRKREEMLALKSKSQMLEKEKAVVMYESLKQQLNPHFLFNSLTSLRSLIRSHPQEAGQFLDGLSKTYRYILKSRDSETVSLGDELRFAETFLQLQLTRFPKGLEYRNEVPAAYHHHRIVPVTIQNLLENAIKHNRIDTESPLIITLRVADGYLIVANNLQKKEFVETSNQQGLRYLKTLYGYMTDRPIRVEETDQLFSISIPLITA